ncbi:MAG TPA: hypothetical protein VGY66_02865 [Gemmataceae bacterium]|jgi:hypothetical protein|nr:hypothetical protein [Gemmataceae bacterium]
MPDVKPPQPPAPARAGNKWSLRKIITAAALAAMLLSCSGMCIVCSGFTWFINHRVGTDTDRVFHEALADGDRAEIYLHADPDFRDAYRDADLNKFARDMPNVFDRARIEGIKLRRKSVEDRQYLVLIARVDDEGMIAFYCRVADSGKLALLGIAPVAHVGERLDKAVPEDIRPLGTL